MCNEKAKAEAVAEALTGNPGPLRSMTLAELINKLDDLHAKDLFDENGWPYRRAWASKEVLVHQFTTHETKTFRIDAVTFTADQKAVIVIEEVTNDDTEGGGNTGS